MGRVSRVGADRGRRRLACGAGTTTTSARASRPSCARSGLPSARLRPSSTERSAPSTRPDARSFGLLAAGPGLPRLRRLRRARARRRAARRPPLRGAAEPRSRSCSTPQSTASSSRRPSTTALRSSAAAREHGLEGVVAKRSASPYRPGRRSPDWRKLKLKQRQELVVAGFTRGKGRRASGIGALVLGRPRQPTACATPATSAPGFTDAELDRLESPPAPAAAPDIPVRRAPGAAAVARRDVTWVEPSLVAEVEFAEWTRDGRLRAPVYLGLREDKLGRRGGRRASADARPRFAAARGCCSCRTSTSPSGRTRGSPRATCWRSTGIIAPVLVPHLRDRPFTMKRYPDGWQGKHFFQKDAPAHMPDWIRRAPFPASTRDGEKRMIDYALVNDDLALLWMVNMGCIDLNAWTSRVDRPDRPDWVIFDLDPSDDVGFARGDRGGPARQADARPRRARELPEDERLPWDPRARPDRSPSRVRRDPRLRVRSSPAALARTHPGLVTTEWTKRKRRGVLVDANQNGPGKTTASVYSVRPRSGRPRLDAPRVGRGARGARPCRLHLRRGPRARGAARRPVRPRAHPAPVARGRVALARLTRREDGPPALVERSGRTVTRQARAAHLHHGSLSDAATTFAVGERHSNATSDPSNAYLLYMRFK